MLPRTAPSCTASLWFLPIFCDVPSVGSTSPNLFSSPKFSPWNNNTMINHWSLTISWSSISLQIPHQLSHRRILDKASIMGVTISLCFPHADRENLTWHAFIDQVHNCYLSMHIQSNLAEVWLGNKADCTWRKTLGFVWMKPRHGQPLKSYFATRTGGRCRGGACLKMWRTL